MLKTFYQTELSEAGCDEAGRGCFAGPVFAAAVMLPQHFYHPLLNDSKQLTEAHRNELRHLIEKEAICFGVASISHDEIDKTNILKASIKAMHLAIAKLSVQPGLLLIDGNRFYKYKKIPHRCIIKGDTLYASIAAASILAKTYRDEWMLKIHEEYPQYHWHTNKGYGTAEHRQAIETYGLSPYHRRSFRLMPEPRGLF